MFLSDNYVQQQELYTIQSKMTDFRTAIKVLRQRKHLTNAELAEKSGLSENTIQRWQTKNKRLYDFDRVCQIGIAFKLEPEIVDQYFRLAGLTSIQDSREWYIRSILIHRDYQDIWDVNRILVENSLKPFKISA